jgi:predicted nucleotidyltransferase
VPEQGPSADLLAATPGVVFAVLFGSRGRGTERPDSDWDVGVLLDPHLDDAERFRIRRQLIAALEPSERTDVVVLNDAPPLLAHRALQGRVLYVGDRAQYVRFFVRTMAEAEDASYWNRVHARARQRRLEEGRFGRP